MRIRLKNLFPPLTYAVFFTTLIGAVLVLKPGWGFMDDFGIRGMAVSFWQSNDKLSVLSSIFLDDINYGRFRPLYYSWAMFFYGVFQNHAVLFNLFLTTVGLLCLLLWGKVLQLAYSDDDNRLLWVYCLSFFIFTPFWNMFMYISLQERFYLVLGGLGFFFYLTAKKRGSLSLLLLAFASLVLLVLGKETGICILATFGAYSLLDMLLLSKEKKLNGVFAGASLLFGLPYVLFLIKKIIGGKYPGTKNYMVQDSHSDLLAKVLAIPLVCKAILFVALGALAYFVVQRFVLKKHNDDYAWILFPMCLVAYIGILIPWGYPTYMLSPVSIFLFTTLYVFVWVMNAWQKNLSYVVLVALSFFVVVGNNIPAIGVMADKGSLAEYARVNLSSLDSQLLMPPPLEEPSVTLEGITGRKVDYQSDGVLAASELNPAQNNYLIMSQECGPFRLENVNVDEEVYRNGTWTVHKLVVEENAVHVVKPDFKPTFFMKLKKIVKSL